MKKNKLLAFILSLALVLGLSAAFTVLALAETPDGYVAPATPDCVYIDGKALEKGKFIYDDSGSLAVKDLSELTGDITGYACYKEGSDGISRLELHNFKLDPVSDDSAVFAKNVDSENTLYIDLYGENSFVMGSSNTCNAIYAFELDLIISEKKTGSSLAVVSNGDGLKGDSVDILGGKISIDCNETNYSIAIASDDYDVTVSGGLVTIKNAEVGIKAESCARIDGGKTEIDKAAYGIKSDDVVINSDLKITDVNMGIFGNQEEIALIGSSSVTINDGTVLIDDAGIGISATKVEINGGDVTISDVDYAIIPALELMENILYSDPTAIILIMDLLKDYSVNVNGGDLTIKDFASYGILTGSLSIKGGLGDKVTITDTADDSSFAGIITLGDTAVSGGSLSIDGAQVGLLSYGKTSIENSKVNIIADTNGISSKGGAVSVKNSYVKVLSKSTEENYSAIYPTVNIIGDEIVEAGTTPQSYDIVPSDTDLGTYQYVNIYPGANPIVTATVFSTVVKAFSGIFSWLNPATWFKGWSFGSFFKLPLWNSFLPFFKLF